MKVAVIGAKGMLGSALARRLGAEHDVTGWDIDDIDITDRDSTVARLVDLGPELVVNSAAWTDVDGCERDPDTAWRINAVGAQNLALGSLAAGSRLLYVSTDYIFDGDADEDYDEVALPHPLNEYGRSKLAGEVLSRQICPRTYIVRTSWLFGHHPNNYVARIMTAVERDGVVRMPADQLESPTYTVHLTQAIADLVAAGAYGCYHIANGGACTRAAFAEFVLKCAGRREPVEIVSAGRTGPARRPRRVVLACRMHRLVIGRPMPSWQEAVQEYFERDRQER
jgi:dTDP-4-dehydrorhamnose reductase